MNNVYLVIICSLKNTSRLVIGVLDSNEKAEKFIDRYKKKNKHLSGNDPRFIEDEYYLTIEKWRVK